MRNHDHDQNRRISGNPGGVSLAIGLGAPASATALAGGINSKRRPKYQGIAAANGTSLEAIEIMVGQKLIARARPGEIVMNASGQWVRR